MNIFYKKCTLFFLYVCSCFPHTLFKVIYVCHYCSFTDYHVSCYLLTCLVWLLMDLLEATGRAASWKRNFLKKSSFETVDDLITSACAGGQAAAFVSEAMLLRYKVAHRHSLQDLMRAVQGRSNPAWLVQLKPQLWELYTVSKKLCSRSTQKEHQALRTLTKRQRHVLLGSTSVKRRRTRSAFLAAEHLDDLRVAIRRGGAVCWVDNYSRLRYSRNPYESRNLSINGTAMAVLPVEVCIRTWSGWPGILNMYRRRDVVTNDIFQMSKTIGDGIRDLLQADYNNADVRVPCDVCRDGVTALAWYPYSVDKFGIGSTEGLVLTFRKLITYQYRLPSLCPVVVDINIYYRMLKAMYSLSSVSMNIHGAMFHHPLLLGCWHCYVHCVKRVHHVFQSVWSPLEYQNLLLPDDRAKAVKVYSFPKLFTLEYMVTAMFLLQGHCTNRVKAMANDLYHREKGSSRERQACMLSLLLNEYVPALMSLGIQVRDLYWKHRTEGTGKEAHTFLLNALTLLLCLDNGKVTEYVRGIVLALMTWSDEVHGRLPGCAFVEEAMEASLSRLAQAAGTDLRAKTAQEFTDMYAALGPADQTPHDLTKSRVPFVFVQQVRIRVDKVSTAITRGTLLRITPQVKKKYADIRVDWPSSTLQTMPLRLTVPQLPAERCALAVRLSLHRLLSAKQVDDVGAFRSLCVGVPELPPDYIRSRTDVIGAVTQNLVHEENQCKHGVHYLFSFCM